MRIVGGKWRGRALQAHEGRGTRPTTDRTRESMASMVLSAFDLDLSNVRVLDAFAGSGAVGLELLSRGAMSCTFVERDRRASGVVKRNISSLGAKPGEANLQVGDVFKLAERGALAGGPFSLVVLDPPYATDVELVAQLVCNMRDNGQLTSDAVILYERSSDASDLVVPGFELIKSKARATTAVTLLRVQPASVEEA